ncbi:MAG: PrsW family glutamic-type intramembrane protease [Patescibacteria group bacterium]
MAETAINITPYAIAFLGGVLPALVWLWFWHRQDNACPEPRGLVLLSFIAGMAVVYFVLPVQHLILSLIPWISVQFQNIATLLSFTTPSEEMTKLILWSFTEEFAKYATIFLIAFQSKYFDEPIDAIIYLITVALGFAAMENALYLFKDLTDSGLAQTLLDGNLRFIGATILHTVSSAVVGIAVAASFYYSKSLKVLVITIGLIIATLLHTYFNFSIMEAQGVPDMFVTFAQFWVAIIIIIILIRTIKGINDHKDTCTTI